jgi:MOSC domain-containing protein YiiM
MVFAGDDFDNSLRGLMAGFPRAGRLDWIGLRPRSRIPVLAVQAAEASRDRGLVGDRHLERGGGGKRQVTLIQAEHIVAMARMIGRDNIDPGVLRRNLVVSGINLLALKDREFRIGAAAFRCTGPCHPCSRMEEALGRGGYNAMRGHGGITAAVLAGGVICLGDSVEVR